VVRVTLSQKTVLIVAVFATANVAIGYSIHRSVVAPEFAELEQREVEKNVNRAREAIRREAQFLDVIAFDSGSWDATYDFMESRDPEYFATNFGPGVLEATVADWVVLVRSDGEVISDPIRDAITGSPIEIPELPQDQWSPTNPLLLGDTSIEPISGLMATSDGPMLIASRDVLTTNNQGPSRGRIIMGRRFDAAFVAAIASRTRIDLTVAPLSDPSVPLSIREALLGDGEDRLHSDSDTDDDRLDVYRLLRDISGEPVLVLRESLPREITQRAAYVNRLSLLWYLVQNAVLGFLIMVLMHSAIIAPLGVLTRQLGVIRSTTDLTVDVSTERSDEIGELSRAFGSMLGQLGKQIDVRRKSEDALRHSEERLQEAQQVAQVGSWEVDLASGAWWWSDELFRIHGREIAFGAPTIKELLASIYAGDRGRVGEAFRALVEDESSSKGVDARFVVASGDLRHHDVLWNIESNPEGRPLRAYGTVSDVTDRYRSEEATRRAAAVFETATEAIVIAWERHFAR
jgi:sensor domain CHASE-containing protein